MTGRHMNVLAIKQQVELASMDNDKLVVMLVSRTAGTARRVEYVADNCGALPHAQVFLLDVLKFLGPLSCSHFVSERW